MLGDTFSFPLQFHDITEDTDTEESWTTLAAKSEKAFSGGPMQSSCEIDLQSLLLQLQQHHIDRLRIWVVFQNGTQDVHINGAQRFPIKGTLNVDHYEADVYARDAATFPINHFSMGYSAAQRASGQYRER